MSSSRASPAIPNDDFPKRDSVSRQRGGDAATSFVLGQNLANDAKSSSQSQRALNTLEPDAQKHQVQLLDHLSRSLGDLLNRTDISDCYLNVKGTFMAVHKCILAARSNAFAAVISGTINRLEDDLRNKIETISKDDKLIIIINKTDVETMKQVVIFMYTAKCDLDQTNAYALLDAAGRYDIKDLKVHTARYLAKNIDKSNILSLLRAAYRYKNLLLKQRCIEFFIINAKEVMEIHELWKKFAEEQQEIVAELLHWHVNQDLFYSDKPQWDAASRWD